MNKIHCSNCLRKTDHNLLFKKETVECEEKINNDPEFWMTVGYYYVLYECNGCHNIVMKKQLKSNTIEFEAYSEESFKKHFVSWYPALSSRKIPDWHKNLSKTERELFIEIYRAYHSDSKMLSIMGLRTVLDMFIVRKIGDKGNFKEKLTGLEKQGYLSADQIIVLRPVIDAGSAAAHRAYQPTSEDLTLALDIVEILLQQDIIAKAIPKFEERIPKRK